MGDMKTGHEKQVKQEGSRRGLLAGMAVLGAFALVLPAWMAEVRDNTPIDVAGGETGTGSLNLAEGTRQTLEAALQHLARDYRSPAAHAIDAAHRAASVGSYAIPEGPFTDVMYDIEDARRALHNGNGRNAVRYLEAAVNRLEDAQGQPEGVAISSARYEGAVVLNQHGVMSGEVLAVEGDSLEVAIGGARDVWGFLDLGGQVQRIPLDAVAAGKPRTLGMALIAAPVEGAS